MCLCLLTPLQSMYISHANAAQFDDIVIWLASRCVPWRLCLHWAKFSSSCQSIAIQARWISEALWSAHLWQLGTVRMLRHSSFAICVLTTHDCYVCLQGLIFLFVVVGLAIVIGLPFMIARRQGMRRAPGDKGISLATFFGGKQSHSNWYFCLCCFSVFSVVGDPVFISAFAVCFDPPYRYKCNCVD